METKETDGERIDLGDQLHNGYTGRTVAGAFDSLEKSLKKNLLGNITREFIFPMRNIFMGIRNQKDPT